VVTMLRDYTQCDLASPALSIGYVCIAAVPVLGVVTALRSIGPKTSTV